MFQGNQITLVFFVCFSEYTKYYILFLNIILIFLPKENLDGLFLPLGLYEDKSLCHSVMKENSQ